MKHVDDPLDPVHESEGRVELATDTSAARWIAERLQRPSGPGVRVGAIVPAGFAAYARILHPAQQDPGHGGGRVRWATVASWTGRVVHPEMQFQRIANLAGRSDAPTWGYRPVEGSLPREECARLVSLLRPFTISPDRCRFCVWEGYGFLDPKRYAAVPRVKTPGRAYLMYRGPIDAATFFHWGSTWQSPNLWWPDDQAWCVASEVDLAETYVGGSEACIDRIVSDDVLEALRTTPDARVDIEGDRINR